MTIMALSATMVVLKGVVALFSLLVAIPKVAIAGLALLTLNLVASRNEWSKWSNHVADTWGAMKNNMSAAMTGVIAALQAANLDLAMEILVAGLELIWEDFWFWIKDGFKTTFSWIIRQFSQITNGIARWSVQAESLWNKLFPPEPPNMDRGSNQWREWRANWEKNNPPGGRRNASQS